MRGLNLDQLRALVEVVEQGSFSAAARRLNLSQPAVSLQIRELETRLGVPLVERMGKRAFATAAGRDVIEHARRIADEVERTLETAHRHRGGWLGRVRIGTGTSTLVYLFPPVLQRLRRDQPEVDLIIRTGSTVDILDLLLRNELDVGVVTLPVSEQRLAVEPLRSDPLVAVAPAGGEALPARFRPADFDGRTLILESRRIQLSRLIRDWFLAEGREPEPAMELDSVEAIKHVVAAGLGLSIVPVEAVTGAGAHPGLAIRPLAPDLQRSLALVRRRDKPIDPALLAVSEALRGLAA